MKCRIRYQPTIWMVFGAPNPTPWRLDIPCVFQQRARRIRGSDPVQTEFETFAGAVAQFQRVLVLVNRTRHLNEN
jgi:hypothetical protein